MAERDARPGTGTDCDDLGVAFRALRAGLRAFLRRRMNDPAVVDDLLQDIFVKAAAAIRARRAPGNLSGWLYAAARTAVADYYRTARPTTRIPEDLTVAAGDDIHSHQELATCLRPLAARLPAIYRDTLLATDFDEIPMKTVAHRQGVSLSAVKSRAARARAMLREQLLACCHVETRDGLVSDYHRIAPPACPGKSA